MSMQIFFTPEGGKFFNNNEEICRYIEEKCGKDIADYFRGYDDIIDILYEYTPYEFEEALEQYDIDESCGELNSPVIKIKRLRKLKEMFEDLVDTFKIIYNKI